MFGLGPMELLIILVILSVFLTPLIFYIRTLSKSLSICSESNRTMSPSSTWLLLVPIFNIFFHFYVVINIAKSLNNEFAKRNFETDSMPGKTVGLSMCACGILSCIPLVGTLFWIIYWVKISEYSSMLSQRQLDIS